MKINEWLETKGINPIDEITLGAVEEFLGGTQLAVAIEAMELAKDHYAFVQGNLLTKREQFAGLAMTGLVQKIHKYESREDLRIDAYAVADEMMSDE